jgi:hypothetical protein
VLVVLISTVTTVLSVIVGGWCAFVAGYDFVNARNSIWSL